MISLKINQSLNVIDAIFTPLLNALLWTSKYSSSKLTLPFLQLLHPFFNRVFHHKLPTNHRSWAQLAC